MTTLALPYPPSTNTYWRHVGARVLISARGRIYRREVGQAVLLAQAQGQVGRQPLASRLAVTIEVQPPDRRRRDLDNLTKALLDALTHAGVWLDDSQIDELRLIRLGPVPGGRVVVKAHPITQQAAA